MTEARPQLLKQLVMAKGNILVGLKQARGTVRGGQQRLWDESER